MTKIIPNKTTFYIAKFITMLSCLLIMRDVSLFSKENLQNLIAREISKPHLCSDEVITNPLRSDGFGGQFQSIIYSVIYAEMNKKKYLYTPFKNMEHNYNNENDFVSKKEQFINFIHHFEINEDLNIQSSMDLHDQMNFFENNLTNCANCDSLKKLKIIFKENKNKSDYFNDSHKNIAVHIRRPNPHDNRIEGTNTSDNLYTKIISFLRDYYSSEKPLFHIYSQGDTEYFQNNFAGNDIVFHMNESIEQTFASMVFADVLVTGTSSFSYTAGLLSDAQVYYIPFWHPPLPHWIPVNFISF